MGKMHQSQSFPTPKVPLNANHGFFFLQILFILIPISASFWSDWILFWNETIFFLFSFFCWRFHGFFFSIENCFVRFAYLKFLQKYVDDLFWFVKSWCHLGENIISLWMSSSWIIMHHQPFKMIFGLVWQITCHALII